MVAALTREIPNPVAPFVLATKLVPGSSVRSSSPLTKKNSLFRMIGPLTESPIAGT